MAIDDKIRDDHFKNEINIQWTCRRKSFSEFKNSEKILIIWFISTKLEEEVKKTLKVIKIWESYLKI